MLPHNLIGSYRQYKADTDYVASWLAETASRCGFTYTSIPITQKPPEKLPKLKGRARMLAKRDAKANKTELAPRKTTQYVVAVKDFLPMAKCIASFNSPAVVVPMKFVKSIERAIQLRKRVGLVFNQNEISHPDVSVKESNERHSFFVNVLETTQELLVSRMAAPTAPEKSETHVAENNESPNLSHLFGGMSVETSTEDDEASSQSDTLDAQNNRYTTEKQTDLAEALLAFTCLVNDYTELRNIIIETWKGFRKGSIDLVTASLTSNTAIELAKQLDEEQKSIFDTHGGGQELLTQLYHAHCLTQNQNPDAREDNDDELNFRMYEHASSIMWPTLQILRDCVQLLTPNGMLAYWGDFEGPYDPSADRERMSFRQMFAEDKKILFDIFAMSNSLWLVRHKSALDDELFFGLNHMFETRQISIWLVFAAQLFLDVHHVLRQDAASAFDKLFAVSQGVFTSIKSVMEFYTHPEIPDCSKLDHEMLAWLLGLTTIVCGTDSPQQSPAQVSIARRRFANLHPIQCGLWAYTIQAGFYKVNVAFTNSWRAVMSCAHLYNAIKQEDLLQSPWKDMETLFAVQGTNRLLAGDPPRDASGYFRRLCLTMGWSASNFATNRRTGRAVLSNTGARQLLQLAEISRMFNDRYSATTPRTSMTIEDVRKILEHGMWREVKAGGLGNDHALPLDGPSVVRQARPRKHWGNTQLINARDLVLALRTALQSEVLEFTFDYMSLHLRCWLWLRNVKKAIMEQMPYIYIENLFDEGHLPFLVSYIFTCMSGDCRISQRFAGGYTQSELESRGNELLNIAATQLQLLME